ncbi:peptide ABC transporter substrate-binding protein [Gallibacterium trehalosifermentans]|uniref:Peptide ABC transporter substrate-binding protein n=1 Tax=Gallibacterium trehalosifermentans TaxID=516935 RepID=A0ABV6H1N4_9PAST
MKPLSKSKFAIIICCCLFFAIACDQQKQNIPTTSNTSSAVSGSTTTLVRAGSFAQLTFDPHQVNDLQNTALLYDLYEGLVSYDIHGNIMPAVAQSWESKDHKNWIFHLRQEAKWSDGSEVTAEDFVHSWQNLLTNKTALSPYLGFIAIQNAREILQNRLPATALGIKAIDPHTLEIQLDKANAHLPMMLAHIALVPVKNGKYNGGYHLTKIDEQKILLMANPYYWNKIHVSFQQVEYWRTNLSSISIDWQFLPPKSNTKIQQVPKLCSYYYELNPHHPTLQNPLIRQALISLISSQSAINNVAINGKASVNLLPQSMRFNSYLNLAPAEQLLMQAKITNQQPLHITLTYDDTTINQQIAQNLSRQFSQSDLIRVSLQAKTQQEWATQHTQQEFQLIRSGWCADYNDPSAFLNNFHSKSPDNLLHYHNPQVDQWLEQAMIEINPELRQQLYQKIIDTLVQEAIVLPLFQYYLPVYIAPNLAGYDLNNPTQIFYSKDLYRLVK